MVCGGLGLTYGLTTRSSQKVTFDYSSKVTGNALMGYAPQATDQELRSDVELVYVDVTWAELEPEKGNYDWSSIEEENQFDRWRSEGKHAVFRFILDYPTDTKHKDIPDWLYDSMDDPGDWYSTSYGKGFSPNYADDSLQSYYKKAVQAMAERWGQDGFLSYIELGGVGHWGEWHVNTAAGLRELPKMAELENFVTPWLNADFSGSQFLMRRPFDIAAQEGMGLYNDMAGASEDTKEWLDWIQNGGTYNQTDEEVLSPMPDAWKTAPIGGELTSSTSMKTLLVTNLEDTRQLVKESHTTFLGPQVAQEVAGSWSGYEKLLGDMGYRLWISKASLTHSLLSSQVSLTWENAGQAPFYKDWQVKLSLVNKKGKTIAEQTIDMDLREILPQETKEVKTQLPACFFDASGHLRGQLKLAIIDPMTDKPAVKLSISGQEDSTDPTLF